MKTQQGSTTFRQHLRESKDIVTNWPSWKKESSPSTASSHSSSPEKHALSFQSTKN